MGKTNKDLLKQHKNLSKMETDKSVNYFMMQTKTKIKLTYFNVRGRAEPSRLILAQAGVEYEDIRIEREDWPKYKSKMPCGQVPVLNYNGVEISQSMAIARFLANEFGLAGKTNLEKARADMIVDCVGDMLAGAVAIIRAPEGQKDAPIAKLLNEIIPSGRQILEKFLTDRYFVGNEITWADLVVFAFFETIRMQHGDEKAFGSCTTLKNHIDFVQDLPRIKRWLEKRPVTSR